MMSKFTRRRWVFGTKSATLTVGICVGVLLAVCLVAVVPPASAGGTNTTYYACLKGGKLTSVGTLPPNCKAPAIPISWGNGTNGTNVLTSPGTPYGNCNSGDTDIALSTDEIWTCLAGNWTDTDANIQGAAGPQGPTGPQGPQGPSGTSHAYSTITGPVQLPTSGPQTASLSVPSGNYVVNVTVNGQNNGSITSELSCSVFDAGGYVAGTSVDILASVSDNFADLSIPTTANSTSFAVDCLVTSGSFVSVDTYMTATLVDALN
jgi:hypothetical protein